jgi:hypothetical protein
MPKPGFKGKMALLAWRKIGKLEWDYSGISRVYRKHFRKK